MDRNTVIGFVLLAVLLFVYLFISTKNSHELEAQQQRAQDSIALVKRAQDSLAALKDTARQVTAVDTTGFHRQVAEQTLVAENKVIRIVFTNKGGQPDSVILKKYKSYNGLPVVLNGSDFDNISYTINTGNGQTAQAGNLRFNPGTIAKEADGSQVVTFRLPVNDGEVITHTFVLKPDDYMVDWTVQMNGADKLLTKGAFNLTWQDKLVQQESDIEYERQRSDLCYLEDGDFDYIMSKNGRDLNKPVQWVSVSQQFFNTTLVAKKSEFSAGKIEWTREKSDTSHVIALATVNLHKQLPLATAALVPMQLYFGPNDYGILKRQSPDQMDKIINLGRDLYAFVRPINKYIIMPVFGFFNSFIGSLGLVIALLTIFLRLVTSPLVYTSYLSGAKMKALRPEIDKLKQKYNGDQQQVGVEQMKLFREAGVNPLGGCIPALLQIPIFFALYSYFSSSIELRGQSFLWANNLASYDTIVKFHTHIWGLGDHLSLFTVLAVTTSFLISIYNMNMTPDQGNPAMKYMPYIFPFVLFFVFNRLPSALTWYYTVSNVITLILQFIIQNYIIDHDQILAKLEANRKKPKAKSKWQEKMEQMQETQKKMQEAKGKGPAR